MSKQYTGTKTSRRFSKLVWVESNNMRDNYGSESETNTTRNTLAVEGWHQNFPIPMVEKPDTPGALTESQLRAEMEKRQNDWDQHKKTLAANDLPHNRAVLEVFEMMYCVPKDNTSSELVLDIPNTSCNAGFRRGRIYFLSQVQRHEGWKDHPSEPVCLDIPGNLMVYESEIDRLINQQQENELASIGVKKMEPREKLRTTKKLFDSGCNEKRIRDLYTSTTGQKAYGICQADFNWTKLGILKRYMLPDEDTTGNLIPWGPTPVPALIKINNRFEAQRKKLEDIPLTKDELAMEPITEQDVDAFFREFANKPRGKNLDKMMPRADIDTKKTKHDLLFMQTACDSIANNTEANLKKFMEHKVAINGVHEFVKLGEGDFADRVVVAMKDHKNIMADVAFILTLPDGPAQLEKAIDAIKNPKPVELPPAAVADVVTPPAPTESNGNSGSSKKQKQRV